MSDETVDEQAEGSVATETPPDAAAGETEAEAETTSTEVAEPDTPIAALEPGPPAVDPMRDRLLLPFLLPLVSSLALLVLVLNISRVLLASGESGSVLVGSIITIGILGGAAAISASPRLRTSTLAMIVAGFVVVVVGAGLMTLGPSEDHGEEAEGYVPPAGPPVATLPVDALPTLKFQSDEFTVSPAGITEITYNNLGGTHTLLFTDPKLTGFELAVPGGPEKGKVELAAGTTYTIYCSVPGHRAAGMEAEVNVSDAAPAGEAPAGEAPPDGAPPPSGPAGATATTSGA